MSDAYTLEDLIYLMERLRHPETGCPWDIKQNYRSITPSTIEEAYEVVDAIEHEDYEHLKEELGDFLFHAVFYTQLAKEEQRFDIHDVIHELTAKLVRRHPHVFPDGSLQSQRDSKPNELEEKAIKASWEKIKQEEREAKGNRGLLDDVPTALPAIVRAAKLQKRASKIGFDWDRASAVMEKVDEELDELKEAMAQGNAEDIENELGDLLFSCVNLARHLSIEPETCLRKANQKFESRFRSMEKQMAVHGKTAFSAAELELLWQSAKQSQ